VERAKLFSVAPSYGIRGNWHKLQCTRLAFNVRKHFFAVRVTEHWHRLWKVVESPSLEILKSHLDACSRWPCLSRRFEHDDL